MSEEAKEMTTNLEILRRAAHLDVISDDANGNQVWLTPPDLVGAIDALLNYYYATEAYSRKNRDETLDWLEERATGWWGDLGASQEVRDEAHARLKVIYDFINELRAENMGADEFSRRGLTGEHKLPDRFIQFGDPVD